jgi:hypothetical protein
MKVGIAGQIDRPFLAQFRPSLPEVSHVAWREAPLEMTGGTKGGAQRAHTLKAYVRWGGSTITVTPIYHLPSKDINYNFIRVVIVYTIEEFCLNFPDGILPSVT